MVYCVLCLKRIGAYSVGVQVISTQCPDLNIKKLIEKHFWRMETIQPLSKICTICWQDLFDFHKFYESVMEAHHRDLAMMEKSVAEDATLQNDQVTYHISHIDDENQKDFIIKKCITENNLKEEIFDEEELITDVPVSIKRNQGYSHQNVTKNTKIVHKKGRNTSKTNSAKPLSYLSPQESYLLNRRYYKKELFKKAGRRSKPTSMPKAKSNEINKYLADNFKFSCSICKLPMQTFSDLRKHIETIHNKRGYVLCCDKKWYSRTDFVDHLHCHSNADYFKCPHCDKVLPNRSNFEIHLETHFDAEYLKCQQCAKAFFSRANLKAHLLTHNTNKMFEDITANEDEYLLPYHDAVDESEIDFSNKAVTDRGVQFHLDLHTKDPMIHN